MKKTLESDVTFKILSEKTKFLVTELDSVFLTVTERVEVSILAFSKIYF